jgi:cytoskeletal protein CcmA (bactofilin family)
MFRKGRQTSGRLDRQQSKPEELGGDGSLTQQVTKEEPMLDRDRSVAASSNSGGTFLSTDAVFKGSLKFDNELRINGKFEGELSSSGTVHVGSQGDVKAEISVGTAIVEGKINGNITASDRVELRSTARMVGDIKASKLIVEEGVAFIGRCEVSSDSAHIAADDRDSEAEPEESEVEVGFGA